MQRLDSCACKAIFGHWSCHDKNIFGRHMHIELTKIKTCVYSTLLGLENMTKYERVAGFTPEPFRTENAMFILFCLRMYIMLGLQWYLRNDSIFPFLFFLFFLLFEFQMSIDSSRSLLM